MVADEPPPWLAAAARHYGEPLRVLGSEPLPGGYVSGDVRRIELSAGAARVSVVWKRSTAREVAALRAVAQVPGIGPPPLVAHGVTGGTAAGEPWVLMPYQPGTPLVEGQPVPERVYDLLARVHAWYFRRRPSGLPVVDAAFWRRLCLDAALPAVRAAAAREPHEAYRAAEVALLAWADDQRISTALELLPATLAHGDLHRGNILGDSGSGSAGGRHATIIDWGNARIAPGGLDLAVLAEQGGVDHDRYRRRLAALLGRAAAPALVEVERRWALATGYVQYLGFAADNLGADRVGVMIGRAAVALERLGSALDQL